MSGRSFDEDELLELLGAVRDEQITPEQAARLESILSENGSALQFYLRYLTMHGLLEQAAVAVPMDPSAMAARPVAREPAGRHWLRRFWPHSAAAAVLIGLAAWWLVATRTGDDEPPATPRVFAWKATPSGNARFDQTSPTSLRLERGEVRIESVHMAGAAGVADLAPMTVETPAGKVSISGSDVLVGTHEPSDSQEKGDTEVKHFTRVLVLVGVATLVNQHGSVTGEANSLLAAQPDRAPVKQAIEANSGFAIDLYRQLTKDNAGKNLFFSPYSVSLALTMTAEGARGATAEEMGKVLHFPKAARRVGADAQLIPWQTALIHTGLAQISRDLTSQAKQGKEKFELRIANALWGELTYRFKPEFVKTLNNSYGIGAAFPCDFAGNSEQERQRINRWVADQTNKRIDNLLPVGSVNGKTRLVLTNAIYFKGDWVQKFDKRKTQQADFMTLAGTRVKTPMMFGSFQSAKFAFIGKGDATQSLRAGTADNFRLVEMPYKGGLSMVLIAPDNPRGLPGLETRLTTENLGKWLGQLQAEKEVRVNLPRFKFAADYELPDALKKLGMVRAFQSPGADGADFSGMSNSGERELTIGGVYHKAFVAVTEEGTEAAAATAVTGLLGEGPKPPPEFAGNRPFLFLIRDPASATILFMGRITDALVAANNDRSEADEQGIELVRTEPTKHPLYQQMKDAAGVALIHAYRDPSGTMLLDGDGEGGMVFKCRTLLALKGELKTGTIQPLLFTMKVQETEIGQAFCDFFSPAYGKHRVLAVYQRQGNRLVVSRLLDADEQALLVASNLFSIPVEKLSGAVKNGK